MHSFKGINCHANRLGSLPGEIVRLLLLIIIAAARRRHLQLCIFASFFFSKTFHQVGLHGCHAKILSWREWHKSRLACKKVCTGCN